MPNNALVGTIGTVVNLNQAFFGQALSNGAYASQVSLGSQAAVISQYNAAYATTTNYSALATTVLTNLSINNTTCTPANVTALQSALATLLAANPTQIGQVISNLSSILGNLTADTNWGVAANLFNGQASANYTYSVNTANTNPGTPAVTNGTTYTLTTGLDSGPAFTGNGIFNAADVAGNATWTPGDTITGTGTGNIFTVATSAALTNNPSGSSVTGVQTANITSGGAIGGTSALNTTGWTGLTALNVTGLGAIAATAAQTTATTVNDAAQSNGAITINGGSSVTVNATSASNGAITVGGTTTNAPTGAVTVNLTAAGAGNQTGGAVGVTGGTTIVVNETLTQTTAGSATTAATVSITGSALTTAVTVSETAAVATTAGQAASANVRNATTTQRGIVDGAVTVADANAGSSTVANTITSVSLNNTLGASTISSTAFNTLTLNGTIANTGGVTALATTEGGSTATVAANRALTINTGTGAITTTGSNTVGAISDASNQFQTVNVVTSGNFYFVNANSAANNVVTLQDTALRTLNISGTGLAAFTNAPATTASASAPNFTPSLANANGINTAITALTVTGGAALLADLSGITGLTTLNTSGTTGAITVSINGTVTAFTGGTGRTILELSAADATRTINLGTNSANELVLMATGSTYQGTGLVTTTNVTGYTQLGVADSTAGATYAYTVSSFASTINTLEVFAMAGTTTNNFSSVAANTALVIDGANTQTSYVLNTGLSAVGGTVNVTFNGIAPTVGTGTIGYTTGTLVLSDTNGFGISTVNMALDASVGGGIYTITNLTDTNLATLNLTGTGALAITNMNTLSTIGTLTINDNTTSSASSTFGAGWTANSVTNLAFTGSHAFNANTLTDTIANLTISNVNTGTTGVVTIAQASTSTMSNLTLTGAVAYTGTDTFANAVTVSAGTDNQAVSLTINGNGAHTVTLGNGGNTYVGGAGVDTVTFGTGANTITTAGGADRITYGVHTGVDTVNVTGAQSLVQITGYNKATSDVVNVSRTTTAPIYSAATGTAGNALAAGALTFQQAAGGAAITATAQVVDITGTVFGTTAANSAAALLTAILSTGSTPLTAGASLTAGATGTILVEYNGFDGLHLAVVTQGTTGAAIGSGSTVVDIADLVGVGTSAQAHLGAGLIALIA